MSSNKNNIIFIKDYAKTLPTQSGVYQMFNSQNKCLYVGKAKNLKNRVNSYTVINNLSPRIQRMILETTSMNHIVTKSEEEALLLESDLIKNLNPRYNILLRDDKSFPYLGLSLNLPYPRIYKIKTKYTDNKDLFGPFANTQTLEELIAFIQRTFKLRVCSDNTFNNRSRPCIYYQISRCSAPCVNKISSQDYKDTVTQTIELLKGNAINVKEDLKNKMTIASENNNFEQAIVYRDRVRMLSKLNLNYSVILPKTIDADFITIIKQENTICIQVTIFKKGRSLGLFNYFPKHAEEDLNQALSIFIIQFYKNRDIPSTIFSNIVPPDVKIITNALKILKNKNVKIKLATKDFKEIISFTESNAKAALAKELISQTDWQPYFNKLSIIFDKEITRIEVFDNSHFKGANMLGVMVVATANGLNNKDYRIFNLKSPDVKKEDDYGTLQEVLTRRLKRLQTQPEHCWPNLLIIDGGANHLNVALKVLNELKLVTKIKAISVAKGENRTFGKEKIILDNKNLLDLSKEPEVFKFVLKLRDEAHRFAINSQRKASLKDSTASFLDTIPGIGKAKKQVLLLHFGSINAIKEASAEHIHDTTKVGKKLAKKILEWLEQY